MSTSTNSSSLPSVEAWENEGGATAPRPAKQTASSRKSSAYRARMNENLRIPAAIMASAMLMPGGARDPDLAIFNVCLKGKRDGIEGAALLPGFLDNIMKTKPEYRDRPIYVTQQSTSKPTKIRNLIAWTFIYIGIFVLVMEAMDKVSFGGVGPGLGIFMIGLIWLAAPFRQTYFPDRRTSTLT